MGKNAQPNEEELETLFRLINKEYQNRDIRDEMQEETGFPPRADRTLSQLRRCFWAAKRVLEEGPLEKGGSDPNDLQTTWKPEIPASRKEGHKDFLVSGYDALKFPTSIFQPFEEEGEADKSKPPPLQAVIYLRAHLRPEDPILLNEEQAREMRSEFYVLTIDFFTTLNSTSVTLTLRVMTDEEKSDREIYDFEPRPTLDEGNQRGMENYLKGGHPTPETRPQFERMLSLMASYAELSLNQQETIEARKIERIFSPEECAICGPWGGIS